MQNMSMKSQILSVSITKAQHSNVNGVILLKSNKKQKMKKKLFKWQPKNRSFPLRFYFQRQEKRLGQQKLILSRQKQKQHKPKNKLKTLKSKLQALYKPNNPKQQNYNKQLHSSQLLQRKSGKIGFKGLLRSCINSSYNFNEYLRISH